MRIYRYLISLLFITAFVAIFFQLPMLNGTPVGVGSFMYYPEIIPLNPPDSNLRFPIPNTTDPFTGNKPPHPMYLNEPSNVSDSVVYDPINNEYIFNSKMGNLDYRTPNSMSFEEYQNYDMDKSLQGYWRERSKSANSSNRGGLIPQLKVGSEVFEKIFGSNTIDIRPQGSAELIFAVINNKRDDPSIDIKQRSTTNFDFQEKIQMSVIAKIGDKIEFKTNYNTESMFAFENKLKLRYEGKEDEILQLLEAGDVNLPLNTTLIQGSQSLFGIKSKLKFGRTTVTTVFSEQKAETKNITVQGGAETNTFNFKADQYEENKHFFIAHYFRNKYNNALSTLPIIGSNINITKIEVWRTNIGAPTTNNRNIVAFTDLGENAPFNTNIVAGNPGNDRPSNNSNTLTNLLDTAQIRNINTVSAYLNGAPLGYVSGQDFEKIESAKKLMPSEYYFNAKLGFISLNSALNSDQVLAIAFQYNIIGDTTNYQVGEFSDEGINDPSSLIVKLIKSTNLNTRGPLWKLMMKNVYSLGAYQVNQQDFRLNILYSGDKGGVPTGYFNDGPKKGISLIRLLHLDTMDAQMNPTPDGVFDFIDNAATLGGTVQANNGRIYMPLIEPFGKDLRAILADTFYASKYCFDSLYTLTKTEAQQYPDKNKYLLEGFYKSASGSEISLGGFNIPQGSVKVTAGGIPLTENVDYTVDYTLGRVRIINEGILNSGSPINISMESNSMFNIMTKRMMGMHANYEVNKDFNIGGTIMNLSQSPLTQKVNYGDEPINNTIWGLDLAYQTESRFLTKMIDALPFFQTKVPSKINFYSEFAHFIPGHSSAIGATGTSYIDDFEGSKSSLDMKNIGNWFLASTPQGQTQAGMFPEAAQGIKLDYGFNRAKLAWYVIDPIFYRSEARPSNVTKEDISKPYVREVYETEVFPNKELPSGQPSNISVLNLAFYPTERGPYNYDVNGIAGISTGLNADGSLRNPDQRWAGIMRKIETTDFEATNVEYIEFWMMDPFIENPTHAGGQLYFNLGDISEDILNDGRKSFENGLPTSSVVTNVDTTIWGRVPKLQALVNSFDNNASSRQFQDVGYDGLNTADELTFFDTAYIQKILTFLGPSSQAYLNAVADPSADNYHYFRGSDFDQNPLYADIVERYKRYNGPDGNSPTSDQSTESYPTNATTMPNVEDINIDNTLSESENYFQYVIDLKPNKMEVGQNFITDINFAQGVRLPNGGTTNVKWYQFKIPLRTPDKTVGKIQNFQSIRFMRMFLKGFSQSIVCRFATLELVRGEWRKYNNQLLTPGDYIPGDQSGTTFDVSAVNIEENGKRTPIPYVIPPGIEREINNTTTNLQKLNEQSLSMKVINLVDGDARAIYKTTDFDFRQFKKLKMYVHAEKAKVDEDVKYGELTTFIRLGSDFTQNYYEIEVPLIFTTWGTSSLEPSAIWPDDNEMIVDLIKLVAVKERRNQLVRAGNANATNYYVETDGKYRYTVVGSPSISNVNTLMIGLRNPKKRSLLDADDMLPKSAEVWVNELRLTDFNDRTGWAATSRVRANLADLGDVALSGTYSTAGFGSIEKKINETQKENITSYDIATNIELGKFFPEKIGLKIPMHYDYSKSISNPEYNPLDPDVKLADDLETYQSESQKDSIRQLVQDYTTRKNLNFMNVRKERTGASTKNRVYDVENLDISYSYSEIYRRNIDIEYDVKKIYRGGLGYNFANIPKNVRPFEKIRFISKYKVFSLVKAFNFQYSPKLMSFRTEMTREYNENKLRNKSAGLILLEPTYFKKFEWSRIYGFRYDPASSLQLEYNATANATIDEPQGRIDTKEKKDSVWSNILDLGRPQRFNQNINISYAIPINKMPIFNWLTAQARYGADYRWEASPLSLQKRLGNTIENNNTKQLNLSVAVTSIFNKIKYLENLNKSSQPSRTPVMPNRRGRANMQNEMPVETSADNDSIKKKTNYFKEIGDGVLRFIMGFKTASISFTENNGILLPGFMPSPVALGNDWNQNAPGLGFIFGSQEDLRESAARKRWLSTDSLSNNPYLTKYTSTVNARASFEPIPDLKIEFTANRTYSENVSQFYRVIPLTDSILKSIPTTSGSFSISYMTILTSFSADNVDYSNATFQKFLDNRQIIASRLANANPNWNHQYTVDTLTGQSYPDGYGPTSQDVLIPAFMAAYSGRDPGGIGLNPFPKFPIPNWTLNYTGLGKIKAFKNIFRTITISNAYRSSYSVGSFRNDIKSRQENGYETIKNMSGNYLSNNQIDQVTITEQFSPLVKVEISWVNSLLTNVEFKKSRNLSLSFVNNQLTELTSNEFIIGLGYRIKDVEIIIGKLLKSDITLKCDFSIRSNKTVLRRVDLNVNQISAGQQVISLNFSADYMLNERFTLRAFFDKVINNPFISSSFPNSTTNAGISVRFSLAQ